MMKIKKINLIKKRSRKKTKSTRVNSTNPPPRDKKKDFQKNSLTKKTKVK